MICETILFIYLKIHEKSQSDMYFGRKNIKKLCNYPDKFVIVRVSGSGDDNLIVLLEFCAIYFRR